MMRNSSTIRGLRAEENTALETGEIRLYHYLIHKCLFYYYYEDTSTTGKQTGSIKKTDFHYF